MPKFIFLLLFFLSVHELKGEFHNSEIIHLEELPVLYQGRFRPLKAYAALSFYELTHKQKMPSSLPFSTPEELLLKMHFQGPAAFTTQPLFSLGYAPLKLMLGLNPKQDLFSYQELQQALQKNPKLLSDERLAEERAALLQRLERFSQLSYEILKDNETFAASVLALKQQGFNSSEMASLIEERFPVQKRLLSLSSAFQMLPLKIPKGTWVSLSALALQEFDAKSGDLKWISNFTLYPDLLFAQIQRAYLDQDLANLAAYLNKGYAQIANTPYQKSIKQQLIYPSKMRLQAEVFYYSFPLLEVTLVLYGFTIFAFIMAHFFPKPLLFNCAFGLIALAFICHTVLLGLRCYILQRPPVSNMFETVIYVPWITVLGSFFFRIIFRSPFIMIGSCTVAVLLLVIVYLSRMNSSLENVQAVLDSQYWLIIHVLMIVGSYGFFLFSGLLGHLSLFAYTLHTNARAWAHKLEPLILQTMYLGTALLIPGTLLGGVWAAESWGRFWDWDPKESWACISGCVYIFWIHLYRFHHIHGFGLAIGSIVGMQSIIFTWYGVNYILGTGLHSYGFGSGGNLYYYVFIAADLLFVIAAALRYTRLHSKRGLIH